MTQHNEPATAKECAALLEAVLACLDRASGEPSYASADILALAAAHIQQAIELIQTVGEADA